MRRRTYAALLALGLGGCASPPGEAPAGGPRPTDPTQSTRSTGASPPGSSSTPSGTPKRSETPRPPGESAFAGADCPPVLDACYHGASADSPAFVRPSLERVPLHETVDFALVNRHDAALTFGPYHWRIWRDDAGGWVELGPDAMLDLGYELPPGEAYRWTVVVDSEGGEVLPGERSAESNAVEFTPGRYCFGVDVDAEKGDGYESLGTLGCLFEVTET